MFERLFGFSGRRSVLIDSAVNDISEMLSRSRRMLELALGTLLDNAPLTADLNQMDDAVDEGERMVRRSVLEHLSFNPHQDLVLSLVLVSMVQDAERTGDFAQGIAELAPLAGSERRGPFRDDLEAVSQRVLPLFDACEAAFRQADSAAAQRVGEAAAEVGRELEGFVVRVAGSDLSADMAVVYSGAARSLRRVAAHLGNIASTVTQPYDRIRHEDESA